MKNFCLPLICRAVIDAGTSGTVYLISHLIVLSQDLRAMATGLELNPATREAVLKSKTVIGELEVQRGSGGPAPLRAH